MMIFTSICGVVDGFSYLIIPFLMIVATVGFMFSAGAKKYGY